MKKNCVRSVVEKYLDEVKRSRIKKDIKWRVVQVRIIVYNIFNIIREYKYLPKFFDADS